MNFFFLRLPFYVCLKKQIPFNLGSYSPSLEERYHSWLCTDGCIDSAYNVTISCANAFREIGRTFINKPRTWGRFGKDCKFQWLRDWQTDRRRVQYLKWLVTQKYFFFRISPFRLFCYITCICNMWPNMPSLTLYSNDSWVYILVQEQINWLTFIFTL